jgi:cytochrome c-type biogenesis protein CcmH/NrfF
VTARIRLMVVLIAVVLGTVGIWRAYDAGPPSPEQRAIAMFEGLRCPTCTAESIADSQALISASMRSTVRDQIAAGRTDEEIREWFVQRYGPTVLLSPPARGLSLALWLLPAGVVLGAVVWWYAGTQRRNAGQPAPRISDETPPATARSAPDPRQPVRPGSRATLLAVGSVMAVAAGGLVMLDLGGADDASAGAAGPAGAAAPSGAVAADPALRALQEAVDRSPGDALAWLALGRELDDRGDLDAAEAAYRKALHVQPEHSAARLRLAFVMVRTDRPEQATTTLRSLLRDEPGNAEALLLLGIVQRQNGDGRWEETLTRLLRESPEHPAAPRVREMLDGER